MTAHELMTLVESVIAGLLLGGIFFGGLCLTVRKSLFFGSAPLWFVGSFLVRTILVLAGFRFVYGGDWVRLVAALVGFTLARFFLTFLVHSSRRSVPGPTMSHAP